MAMGFAAFWAAAQVFIPALDVCLSSTKNRARRALDKNAEELDALQASLRSIREAYAVKSSD